MKLNFDPISVEDHHFLLASHNPQGSFWKNAFNPNDNFGKIFLGLAVEFYRFQVLEKNLYNEMDIMQANELLVKWEKSVGLPDSCFRTDIDIDKRRKQVYAKFSKFQGVQKKVDFIRLAAFFGYTITVLSGKAVGTFPLSFPLLFFSSTKSAKHSLVFILIGADSSTAQFPLPFPIPFSFGAKGFLQCIFRKLAPANTEIFIFNEGDI